jgi:rRNA biogenesis protein RRP5
VATILDKALILDLFGGMRAFVPIAEAADDYVEDLARRFTVGQTVQARIVRVDTATSRVDASIRKVASQETPAVDVSGIEVGASTSGVVEALHPDNLVLRLEPWGATGLLSLSTLSRYRNVPEDDVRAQHPVGTPLTDLRVVSKNETRRFLIVGFPRPTNAQLGIARDIVAIDTLEIGQTVPVRLVSRDQHGLLVQVSRNLRGRINWTDMADDFDEAAAIVPSAGASAVPAVILGLDKEASRIDLSLRASAMDRATEPRDPVVADLADLRPGMRVRGLVKNVSDAGLFVAVGRNLTARVQIKVRRQRRSVRLQQLG